MRKRLIVTLMLILITLLGGMLYVLYAFFSAPRAPVKVGVYYYVWYMDGNGTYHWNGKKDWTVVDVPLYLTFTIQQTKVSLNNTWIGLSMRV
jgi:hypothetical protein